jgi:hypothetical protein
MTRFEDFDLDVVFDFVEGLDGVGMGSVGLVEIDGFVGRWRMDGLLVVCVG